MSVRMAMQIGLHCPREGRSMRWLDREIRNRVWYSCYMYELIYKMWSPLSGHASYLVDSLTVPEPPSPEWLFESVGENGEDPSPALVKQAQNEVTLFDHLLVVLKSMSESLKYSKLFQTQPPTRGQQSSAEIIGQDRASEITSLTTSSVSGLATAAQSASSSLETRLEEEYWQWLPKMDAELTAWFKSLPGWMHDTWSGFSPSLSSTHPPTYLVALLHILYHTTIAVGFYPSMIASLWETPNDFLPSQAYMRCQSAAEAIADMLRQVLDYNPELHHMFTSVSLALFNAGMVSDDEQKTLLRRLVLQGRKFWTSVTSSNRDGISFHFLFTCFPHRTDFLSKLSIFVTSMLINDDDEKTVVAAIRMNPASRARQTIETYFEALEVLSHRVSVCRSFLKLLTTLVQDAESRPGTITKEVQAAPSPFSGMASSARPNDKPSKGKAAPHLGQPQGPSSRRISERDYDENDASAGAAANPNSHQATNVTLAPIPPRSNDSSVNSSATISGVTSATNRIRLSTADPKGKGKMPANGPHHDFISLSSLGIGSTRVAGGEDGAGARPQYNTSLPKTSERSTTATETSSDMKGKLSTPEARGKLVVDLGTHGLWRFGIGLGPLQTKYVIVSAKNDDRFVVVLDKEDMPPSTDDSISAGTSDGDGVHSHSQHDGRGTSTTTVDSSTLLSSAYAGSDLYSGGDQELLDVLKLLDRQRQSTPQMPSESLLGALAGAGALFVDEDANPCAIPEDNIGEFRSELDWSSVMDLDALIDPNSNTWYGVQWSSLSPSPSLTTPVVNETVTEQCESSEPSNTSSSSSLNAITTSSVSTTDTSLSFSSVPLTTTPVSVDESFAPHGVGSFPESWLAGDDADGPLQGGQSGEDAIATNVEAFPPMNDTSINDYEISYRLLSSSSPFGMSSSGGHSSYSDTTFPATPATMHGLTPHRTSENASSTHPTFYEQPQNHHQLQYNQYQMQEPNGFSFSRVPTETPPFAATISSSSNSRPPAYHQPSLHQHITARAQSPSAVAAGHINY
ncbi:hypothetical protein HK102_014085 [Quaeritorhiza haematococci]|nr:hypothetical protein HK102_014085 [Quaeritorhiza haematococci]